MTTTEQTNNFGFCLIVQKRANGSEACRSFFYNIISMLKIIEYVQLSPKIHNQLNSGKKAIIVVIVIFHLISRAQNRK